MTSLYYQVVFQWGCRVILDPVLLSRLIVTFLYFFFFKLPSSRSSSVRSEGTAWRKCDRSHLASLPLWTHPPSSPLCASSPLSSLALCDHLRQTLTVFSVYPLKGCGALGGQIKRGLPVSHPIRRHRVEQEKKGGKGDRQRGLAGTAAMLKEPSPSHSSTVPCCPLPNTGQWGLESVEWSAGSAGPRVNWWLIEICYGMWMTNRMDVHMSGWGFAQLIQHESNFMEYTKVEQDRVPWLEVCHVSSSSGFMACHWVDNKRIFSNGLVWVWNFF